MLVGSLRHVQHIAPISAVELGYCKNYTVQKGLDSNIKAEHKILFESEFPLTVTRKGSALNGEFRKLGTAFLNGEDAAEEAERLIALWGVGRDIYEFEGFPELLQLRKGQRIILYHELDGMESGVEAQVLELVRNWVTRDVTVRFLK